MSTEGNSHARPHRGALLFEQSEKSFNRQRLSNIAVSLLFAGMSVVSAIIPFPAGFAMLVLCLLFSALLIYLAMRAKPGK